MKRCDLYRCPLCGLQIEVTVAAAADISAPLCCGQEMKLQKMNSTDGAGEKHLPSAESIEDGTDFDKYSVFDTFSNGQMFFTCTVS